MHDFPIIFKSFKDFQKHVKMEKIGILIPTITPRDHCLANTLKKSTKYDVELFIIDNQNNPFVKKLASEYVVTSSREPEYMKSIVRFAKRHESRIYFAIAGSEVPYLSNDGFRNELEKETSIQVIGAKKEYVFERSKVLQRRIVDEVAPWANPRYEIFKPEMNKDERKLENLFFNLVDELAGHVVIKPDIPQGGKGVKILGIDLNSPNEALHYLNSVLEDDVSAVVEQKLDGEEFTAVDHFDKAGHIASLPFTRDYKRGIDGDKGYLTGGMGSYRDRERLLPFMSKSDADQAADLCRAINGYLVKRGMIADAFGVACSNLMATSEGVKFIESNYFRLPDPEACCLFKTLAEDYIEICMKMLDGNITTIRTKNLAAVTTVAAPLDYGGYRENYTGDRKINLDMLFKIVSKSDGKISAYTGALEQLNDGTIRAMKSRTLEVVGIGTDIEEARERSLTGIRVIDGPLQNRWDIGSRYYIQRSIDHMKELRNWHKPP